MAAILSLRAGLETLNQNLNHTNKYRIASKILKRSVAFFKQKSQKSQLYFIAYKVEASKEAHFQRPEDERIDRNLFV